MTTEKATSSPASNKDCFIMLFHKGVVWNFNQKAALTELEWTDRL